MLNGTLLGFKNKPYPNFELDANRHLMEGSLSTLRAHHLNQSWPHIFYGEDRWMMKGS